MDTLRPASQRLQRLREISLELGFATQDDLPLPQPVQRLSVTPTAADEHRAEFILANIRAETSAGQPQKSGLKKAFSTSKKKETPFTSNEIHDAIAKEVCLNGQAEVVEVLHNRLIRIGHNPNFSRRVSGNVIKKMKGVEQTNERSRLLQTAVEMQRIDFVRIFAPHADQISLDESLQVALPNRCLEIIEILLEWGADASTSLPFVLHAAQYGDAEFVGVLLQSKKLPTSFSESLLPAAVNGSLRTVSLLMKAGANGDHQEAAALRHAVGTGREDLATVIIMGQKPPSSASLNAALGSLLSNPAINLHQQLRMTDILLCGGPIGDASNESLIKATQHSCIPMMKLLLEARASVDYRDGAAVRHAIARGRPDLLDVLLQTQTLSPQIASMAMGSIDLKAPSECKISIASKLLSQKATGHHTNELLVHAIETDDILLAAMLAGQGADANHNAARGLVLAVSRLRLDMVEILLRTSPSTFSLCKAFEAIPRGRDTENGHSVAQALLKAGAKGNEVDSKLLAELNSDEGSKDFIDLLVNNGAQVSSEMILTSVSKGNYTTLKILLGSQISPSVISEAIPIAMKIQDPLTRFRTLKFLLQHPTPGQIGPVEIIQAIVDILKVTPHDVPLLSLLCQDNRADVNSDNGQAVILAIGCQDPLIFNTVIKNGAGIINSQTVSRALAAAMDLPVSECRQHIIATLLLKARPQEPLNQALVQEICLALRSPRDHGVIQALLAAGADVDALHSASVCHAVRDPKIMDLLLLKKPSQQSLTRAFPLAMALQVPEERLHMCRKLLRAGVVGEEINKALCHAAKESPLDISLMQLLAPQADVNFSDGQALRRVIRRNHYDVISLILNRRPSVLTLLRGLREAMNVKSIDVRLKIVKVMLEAGAKGELVSECLIIAVNQGDLSLCELLVRHGASIEYLGGQGIISAASSGNAEILDLLTNGVLCSKPTLSSVTAGFGAATSLRERGASFYDCAQILLRAGLRGEAVDKALVEAVKEGDSNLKLSKLFMDFGAGVEFQEGEAINVAASSAFVETLGLLLTAKPSQNVLKRAFRSSLGLGQDERRLVCELVLKAGKTIDKHVTNTLLQATQAIPADRPLIRTLLAAQVYDDGQSVQHAAHVLDLETLNLLLESPRAQPYVSSSFSEFTKTEVPWKSNKGPSIVLCFLSHGASGQAVDEALLDATDRSMNASDGIASQILDSLLQHKADVNYQRGLALQRAAKKGNIVHIRKLLSGAGADARMMAFPYLFVSETSVSETDLLHLIREFTDAPDPENSMGVGFSHPDPSIKPVIFMALEKYPRKSQILRALMDAGFNPFPVTSWELDSTVGKETVSVLCWAIDQPEKRISSENINLLIDRGNDVNFKSKTNITPVMLSIRNHRFDILDKLINKGAKVTDVGNDGFTPLAMASCLGSAEVMAKLLEAGAEIDDGSLHDAARELRAENMRVLMKFGHDPDYPSDRHDGRSALAELCLNANCSGRNLELEEAISCLIANGADIKLRCGAKGKSIFHYALDSSDPVSIVTVLLKLLWKVINDDCYLYDDGKYTYSLSKYVEKHLFQGPHEQTDEILKLLRNKRATDRFWANSIDDPQPSDMIGAPQPIVDEVQHQRVREKRKAELKMDLLHSIELKRLAAIEEDRILSAQNQTAIQRQIEASKAQLSIQETQADQSLRLSSRAELERQRLLGVRHTAELQQARAVGQEQLQIQAALSRSQIATAKAIEDGKIESERMAQMLQIEYVGARSAKENEGVKARLMIENDGVKTRTVIENDAMAEREKIGQRMHDREMVRLAAQKRLLEGAAVAPSGRMGGGQIGGRQIGYIMGEVPSSPR